MSQPSSSSTTPYPFPWTRGRIIGSGSFAVVYSGSCIDPNGIPRQIAVKTALVDLSSSLRRERRIFKEFRGCPEILACFAGEESVEGGQGFYNLLLEFAPAGTLDSLIAKSCDSHLPESEARVYARMILKGLDCIHSRGFVHCDIKPENILAFPCSSAEHWPCKYQLKIGDFGLAVGPGEYCWRGGTPDYMSPESAAKKEVGPGLDVWSLGCTLVEMITGKNPWWERLSEGAEMADFIELLGKESPSIPEGTSESGKDFLRKCFERDPKRRWTARMLLGHPYVSGLGSERTQETAEVGGCGGGAAAVGNVVPVGRYLLPHETMIRHV